MPDYAQLGEELCAEAVRLFQLDALRNSWRSPAAIGREKFRKLQIEEFISSGQTIPQETRELCGIPAVRIRDAFSSVEIGPIAFECGASPGAFHVATSNVVVECEESFQEIDGQGSEDC